MKHVKRLTACVLAMCMVLSLAACHEPPTPTTTPTTVPPTTAAPTTEAPNEGLILYQAARETLENQENVGLVISVTETMNLPAEQLVTNIRQDVSYVGIGTDQFKAVVQDTSCTSSGTLRNKETFSGGKVYIRAFDGYYLSELTAEDYIARYLPAVLIDENLYESIDYTLGDYTTEIRFSNATDPESWFPENAVVTEASGTAEISSEGKLKKYTYDVTFSILGATIRQEISIVVTTPQVTQIEVPSDVSDYLPIPHPDVLKLADLAFFQATSSTSISCSVMCETVCNAGAIRVLDVEELETYDNGTYMAQVDFTREYTNLETMETDYYSQQEFFRKNIYSISTNGGKAENDFSVDRQMMQDYIYDEVICGWIDYGYMTECAATNLGNILLIEFRGNDELARDIEDGISDFLFDDEAFLDDLASKYETVQMDYYIAIDNDDEIPFDIPETWVWIRVGDIGSWGSGATPSRTNPAYYGGSIPWLKTGDLNDGFIKEVPEYITELALEKTSVRLNPVGSVLMAMYGATIGKLGILEISATTNQACCACIPYAGMYNKYIFYYLMSMRKTYIGMAEGGAQPNISKEKIVNSILPLPPLEEQQRMAKI